MLGRLCPRPCRRVLCRAGRDGGFRTKKGESDPAKTKAMLELWEAAVQRFHDPEVNTPTARKRLVSLGCVVHTFSALTDACCLQAGINIVIGPVTAYSASAELLRGAAELRRKHGLLGHIHLLETRVRCARPLTAVFV